ncbi:Crp/Fnr family transcriptional regulator [Pseudomonadota bacterium]
MNDEALARCALFADLSPEEVALVVNGSTQYTVPGDHVFFDMEERNESLYVVLSGAVRVQRAGTETDTELATLRSGSIFGEMSFIDGSKTSAQVHTIEPTDVLELKSEEFQSIIAEHPQLEPKLWRNLALEFKHRLAHTNELVDYYADLTQVLRDNPGAASLLGT